MRGKFIVFEGGDGSGKDTQLDLLKKVLPTNGFVFTREPGGTDLGKELRQILLDRPEEIPIETEAFLFLTDRAHHVATRVSPTLAQGIHVISNRAFYSSIAYQVFGRNRPDLRPVMDFAHSFIYKNAIPDLVVWLDLDPKEGICRAEARGVMNRIDRAPLDMHQRIREGFQAQLEGKSNVLKIDATRSIEEIHQGILGHIQKLTMV